METSATTPHTWKSTWFSSTCCPLTSVHPNRRRATEAAMTARGSPLLTSASVKGFPSRKRNWKTCQKSSSVCTMSADSLAPAGSETRTLPGFDARVTASAVVSALKHSRPVCTDMLELAELPLRSPLAR